MKFFTCYQPQSRVARKLYAIIGFQACNEVTLPEGCGSENHEPRRAGERSLS